MTTRRRISTFESSKAVEEWKTVDDVVMGGRSESRIFRAVGETGPDGSESSGVVRFEGEISLENNGGFCSARLVEAERGVPGLRQLILVARGDGNRYKCTLRTRETPDHSSWRLPFDSSPGRWKRYRLPIESFELWRRGTLLSADRVLDPSSITSFGLLVSDEQEGEFRIDLAGLLGVCESGNDG